MVAFAIDEGFEHYALRNKAGAISVRRVADGQEFFQRSATPAGAGLSVLALSPDGRYLLADNPEQQVQVWDLERKEPTLTLAAGDGSGPFSFSPDSRRLVVYAGGAFSVYDVAAGRRERRFPGTVGGCRMIVFHPDGRQFAAFSENGPVQFWSADSGRLLGDLPVPGMGIGSFSPDGRLLLLSDNGTLLRLWDVPNRRQVGVLEGHKNLAVQGIFNPTGDLVASNGWEAMLRLWDPRTDRQLLRMPTSGGPRFNRSGDQLLLLDKVPQLWNVADGREYRTFVADPIRGKKVPYGCSISPDGRFLAAGTEDGTVIWELSTGNELAHLRTGRLTWHVLFQPSGDLLTSGRETGLMRWPIRPNPDAEGEYRIGPPERLVGGSTDGVAQSQDGRTIVVALSGVGGQIVDLDHPGLLREPLRHEGTNKASISPDGKWAATGCYHGTGIKVWSVRENRLETELPIEGTSMPVFSPDGRWLATTSSNGLQLWKVGTWERGLKIASGEPLFPPDSGLIAVREKYTVTLFDPDSGRRVATLEDPNQDRPGIGCFSADGALLALPTEESYSIHVWDLRRIRVGLKGIDLDWTAPDYPPAPPPHAPVRFQVLDGRPGQPPPLPLVVLAAPGAKYRLATPEQIAAWIKQLADRDAKRRTEAETALEEVGPAALKALDAATGPADAAVRQRLKQVRDRIALADALTPKRVSLKVKDAPLADVVKALSDQAGVRLNYNPRASVNKLPKSVTLELEGVPILEALDRLCQAATLVLTPHGADEWNLSDGPPAAKESVAYAGPVRLRLPNLRYGVLPTLPGEQPTGEQLLLHLLLGREAGAAIVIHGRLRVAEAVDDAGRDLRPNAPEIARPGGEAFGPFGIAPLSVGLAPPSVRGGTLKQLKLVLPVEVLTRRGQDLLTATDLPRADSKAFAGGDGVRMTIQAVHAVSLNSVLNSVEVLFTVSVPEDRTLDPTTLGLRWTDARGKAHEASDFTINSTPRLVREVEAEDLLWWTGSPQSAFPTQLPLAALAQGPRQLRRRQWTGRVQVNTPDAIGSPTQLTLVRFERLRTELAFEFHDLPLP
jgi:WD40 repeat protein